MAETSMLVTAWCELDRSRAMLPADREAIEATLSARALIVEQILAGAGRDLFHACAMLGRLLAERGASPTFAVATIDGVHAALGGGPLDWTAPARAAVVEGFAAATLERADLDARARWEYPRCAVKIDATTVCVAAGYPEDDGEALAAWAERVALACRKAGARRAMVAGGERATAALESAMSVVGVERVLELAERGRPAEATEEARKRRWPWQW